MFTLPSSIATFVVWPPTVFDLVLHTLGMAVAKMQDPKIARGHSLPGMMLEGSGHKGERERSGVYWKPKGAAAERAGPSTILPHPNPYPHRWPLDNTPRGLAVTRLECLLERPALLLAILIICTLGPMAARVSYLYTI